MAKTRFYLIRHGQTDWNKEKRYQGCSDIALSDAGKEQAEALGQRFRRLPLDALYVSPLRRAIQTAEPISRITGIPMEIDEHFKEINLGEWEGHTIAELEEMYGDTYRAFYADPFDAQIPGEGSFHKAGDRALEGLRQLMEKHEGQRVAIVSHGGLLRIMLVLALEVDKSFYRKTWMSNTSITTLDVMENGKLRLTGLNDKAHLEALYYEEKGV